jgi:ABC-type nitrate/sulfonate/bicarbonate transport system substrate-binding protein
MKNYIYLIIALIVIGGLIFVFLPEKNPNEITIGYSALRISIPVFVAFENGYFADEGLNVKLERFDTAQPLMQSLVAGNIDIAGYTALPITYNSMIRGDKELYFVTSMIEDQDHLISYFLVSVDEPNEIKVSDFKGKKIGVLPTIAYQKWLEVILNENGLTTKDVEILPINPALQPVALESGQVDALFTNDPAATTAIETGIARKISDESLVPKFLGEPFIFGSFNIDKTFADQNPDTTKAIIRGLDKAVMFVNENPTESKQIMKKFVHDSQKPFVDSYPNALYLTSAKSSEDDYQDVANQYLEIGIIDQSLSIENLIVSEDDFD